MKRNLLLTAICLGWYMVGFAQWTGITPSPITTKQSVGIGTFSPSADLHIVQDMTGSSMIPPLKQLVKIHYTGKTGLVDSTTFFSIMNNGFVGIGEANPLVQLHVNGQGYFKNNLGLGTLLPQARLHVKSGDVKIENGDFMLSNSKGDVQVKAFRDGLVWAREFKVNMQPIPDYVFAGDYTLMSLHELEQYIAHNKHLPGIPSAAEYESQGGVNMGELQLKLLEKVEELTLYVIRLDKENAALRQQLQQISTR